MSLIFHSSNIGKIVTLHGGMTDEISSILKSGMKFRVKSQANGPIIHDYSFFDIAEVEGLVVAVFPDEWSAWSVHGVNASVAPAGLTPPVTTQTDAVSSNGTTTSQ